jgi:hypothetical protein
MPLRRVAFPVEGKEFRALLPHKSTSNAVQVQFFEREYEVHEQTKLTTKRTKSGQSEISENLRDLRALRGEEVFTRMIHQ